MSGKRDAPPYGAFISYSTDGEADLARALKYAIRDYGRSPLDWLLRPGRRIFIDEASLGATADAMAGIAADLDRSEYLILIASSSSARSVWVKRELRYWLGEEVPQIIARTDEALDDPIIAPDPARAARLLIAIAEGEYRWRGDIPDKPRDFDWDTCDFLPRCLEGVSSREPIWADLRGIEPPFARRNDRFWIAVAKLAGPIHGVSPEEIIGEERKQRRRLWGGIGMASSLLTFLAGAWLVAAWSDLTQRSWTVASRARLDNDAGLHTAARRHSAALSEGLHWPLSWIEAVRGRTVTAAERIELHHALNFDRRCEGAFPAEDFPPPARSDGFPAWVNAFQREQWRADLARDRGLDAATIAALEADPEGFHKQETVRIGGGPGFMSLTTDGELRVYSGRNGRYSRLRPADGDGVILAFAASPDGTRIAAGTDTGRILIWRREIVTGLGPAPEIAFATNPHGGRVFEMAFDAGGTRLRVVADAGDGTDAVSHWNVVLGTGDVASSPTPPAACTPGAALAARIRERDGAVALRRCADGAEAAFTLPTAGGRAEKLALSGQGDLLAVIGNLGAIWVLDLEDEETWAEPDEAVLAALPRRTRRRPVYALIGSDAEARMAIAQPNGLTERYRIFREDDALLAARPRNPACETDQEEEEVK